MDDAVLKTMEESLVERFDELVAADERACDRVRSLRADPANLPEVAGIVIDRRIILAEQRGLQYALEMVRTTRRTLTSLG